MEDSKKCVQKNIVYAAWNIELRYISKFVLLVFVLIAACNRSNEKAGLPPVSTGKANESVVTLNNGNDVTEVVTISFAIYDWEQAHYESLIKIFEEENPDIKIRLVFINEILDWNTSDHSWPEDAILRLASAADVLNVGGTQSATRQGALLDLQPLIDTDRGFSHQDFLPGSLEQYQWDKGIWSLPTMVHYTLVFYNKDAFDMAGIDYPQPGWSSDDFLTTTHELTLRTENEVTQWGYVEPILSPLALIQTRAGTLVDRTSEPPVVHLNNEAVIEAVRWYTNLFLFHEVAPYFPPLRQNQIGGQSQVGSGLVQQGRAAIWQEPYGNWSAYKQRMNVGAVPFPVGIANDKTTPMWANGVSISAGTARPQAAWRWLTFLSYQVSEGFQRGDSMSLPARRSVAEAIWTNLDEDLAFVLRYAADHAYSPLPGELHRAVANAIAAIMSGEKSVEQAMADAQVEAQTAVEETWDMLNNLQPVTSIVVAEPEKLLTVREGEIVAIEFMLEKGSQELGAYRNLARQFQEVNPGIMVELTTPDLLDGSFTLKDAATISDCFQWSPDLNEDSTTAILSLEPFFDTDQNMSKADFYSPILEQFKSSGQLWGLPAAVDMLLVEYNKSIFDEHDIDYPSVDWTVDEFLDLVVILTEETDEGKQYGYLPEPTETVSFLMMIKQLGASPIDNTVIPPRIQLDHPDTIASIEWYIALSNYYGVKPDLASNDGVSYVQWQSLIESNRAAMWAAFASNTRFSSSSTLPVGVVPFPVGTNNQRGANGEISATGYFISRRSTEAQAQACWQWLTFLVQQPDAHVGLPAHQATAESTVYQQLVGLERATVYDFVLGNYTPSLSVENAWLHYENLLLLKAFGLISDEGLAIESALKIVQLQADEFRTCLISRNALNNSTEYQACWYEVDN